MIATVKNDERIIRTRARLIQLREMGFKFIVTKDDGDTWIGTNSDGIAIADLIETSFQGTIRIDTD